MGTTTYYDMEFLEDGHTIETISIGMARQDDQELYLINRDAPLERIARHEWLMANVVPHLPIGVVGSTTEFSAPGKRLITPVLAWDEAHADFARLRTRAQIADEVSAFIGDAPRAQNQLWGWYSAYDHVALCQLFGRMIDLPPNVPMFTRDFKQVVGESPVMPQTGDEHHALADAKWLRAAHRAWLDQWNTFSPLEELPMPSFGERGYSAPFSPGYPYGPQKYAPLFDLPLKDPQGE